MLLPCLFVFPYSLKVINLFSFGMLGMHFGLLYLSEFKFFFTKSLAMFVVLVGMFRFGLFVFYISTMSIIVTRGQ